MGPLMDRKTFVLESQEEVTAKRCVETQNENANDDFIIGSDIRFRCGNSIMSTNEWIWKSLIPQSYRDFLSVKDHNGSLPGSEYRYKYSASLNSKEAVKYDIPVEINRKVMYFIYYFQTKIKGSFSEWLSRSSRYVPLMKDIFRENSLPEDLVYLALIESGFNPKAYSSAHACGPWQFIRETGRRYGMRVDWWIDERRDPEKSTMAAAQYLKDLYDRFDSWYLAAAAYNAGENTIERAIQECKTKDFWEISGCYNLKEETVNYIPKLIAGMIVAKNPGKYGFGDIEYQSPLLYDRVHVPTATYLEVIASACGTDYHTIRMLNPELRRGCTPPNYTDYEVKIPYGKEEAFYRNFERINLSGIHPEMRCSLQDQGRQ